MSKGEALRDTICPLDTKEIVITSRPKDALILVLNIMSIMSLTVIPLLVIMAFLTKEHYLPR
eukprot:16003171-Heterocapsa_arctica.AAC.1